MSTPVKRPPDARTTSLKAFFTWVEPRHPSRFPIKPNAHRTKSKENSLIELVQPSEKRSKLPTVFPRSSECPLNSTALACMCRRAPTAACPPSFPDLVRSKRLPPRSAESSKEQLNTQIESGPVLDADSQRRTRRIFPVVSKHSFPFHSFASAEEHSKAGRTPREVTSACRFAAGNSKANYPHGLSLCLASTRRGQAAQPCRCSQIRDNWIFLT